jgi:hypothetical protein
MIKTIRLTKKTATSILDPISLNLQRLRDTKEQITHRDMSLVPCNVTALCGNFAVNVIIGDTKWRIRQK